MKLWFFRGFLAATPVLLLLLVEAALRLFDLGGYPPLQLTLVVDGERVLMSTNARFPERFFQERYDGALLASGRMRGEPFVADRPQRYRVVVVGASSVQGYPHPHRLAFPAFLRAMLQDVLPDRVVEVFNLGITPIASFAVARTVDEALAMDPDVVVVYSGHNEFYGLFGGAEQSKAAVRYHLMGWRLPHLMQRGADWVSRPAVASRQLLESLARRGQVHPRAELRERAAGALSHNLRVAVQAVRAAGARPVLCTLVANLEDFAPAGSLTPDTTAAAGREAWAAVNALHAATYANDDAAVTAALTALDLYHGEGLSGYALTAFARGRALRRSGRHAEASAELRRALELDTMPWRAPAAHNDSIRQLAADLQVELVDVEAEFGRAAAPRLPGWEWMVDHVHPSVQGQALIARTIAGVLLDAEQVAQLSPIDTYVERHGWIRADGVRVDQAMAELLGAPPMDRFHRHAAEIFRQRGARRWRELSAAERRGSQRWMKQGEMTPLALELANELYVDRQFAAAQKHYRAARLEAPYTPRGDLWASVQLGWCAHLQGAPLAQIAPELRESLARVAFVARSPGVQAAYIHFVRGSLHHFLGDSEAALAGLEQAFLDETFRADFLYSLFPLLAEQLLAVGRADDARRYAAMASAQADNPYFERLVESLRRGT